MSSALLFVFVVLLFGSALLEGRPLRRKSPETDIRNLLPLLEAMSTTGDFSRIDSVFSDDASVYIGPQKEMIRGRDFIRRWLQELFINHNGDIKFEAGESAMKVPEQIVYMTGTMRIGMMFYRMHIHGKQGPAGTYVISNLMLS